MFAGAHTALVTPFNDDASELDESAYRRIIDLQFDNGISGVVPAGTTGESPTLTHDEHKRVIEIAVEQTGDRGVVIAGTGSNSTKEAIELTRAAERAGAQASLQVAPYYNKPSQEGLFQHFKAIADATAMNIMLYSIPGRCGIAIEVETVARLHEACPNISAIKEAGGSVERVSQFRAALPDGFEILSGDDSLTLPFISAGACGVVSVASNLVPVVMAQLVAKANGGDFEGAAAIHRENYPFFSSLLKLDTNPIPIKAAMAVAGHCGAALRMPLVPLSSEKQAELEKLLVSVAS
ncbi:MAG: 4-hydroxy-tetrahydrodipicolinate synthase [Verrucomicrobiota bacterium]